MKRPAFQFYVADWFKPGPVRAMSAQARGVYIDLLAFSWDNGGILEADIKDPRMLCRLCNVSKRSFTKVWEEICGRFDKVSGEYGAIFVNTKLELQRKSLDDYSKRQSENIKKRWVTGYDGNTTTHTSGNTLLLQSSSVSSTSTAKKKIKDTPASPEFDFEDVYREYPRKEGRKKGLQRFKSQITTREKYDALVVAVKNYAASITDPKYTKHFDTFMGCWEDYGGDWKPPAPAQPTSTNKSMKAAADTEIVEDF